MISVIGGLSAALLWATATIVSSRSSRLIGSPSVVAWVMSIGLVAALPGAALTGVPAGLDPPTLAWLALVAFGNVAGLVLVYAALRLGKVGIVAPITSTEGALTALIAVVLGERIVPGAGVVLVVIAVGIVLASIHRDDGTVTSGHDARQTRRAALLSIAAASIFALGLYAAGHVSATLPPTWVVLPARVAGTAFLAVPMVLTGRLQISRAALPLVIVGALAELVGSLSFAWGAHSGIAITAVLSSQFAALAALAAYVLFGERLQRHQVVAIAVIAIGVATLSYLQA